MMQRTIAMLWTSGLDRETLPTMSDIVSPTPVFALDRLIFVFRAAIVDVVEYDLNNGAIVPIENNSRPHVIRLCYEVRPGEAFHLDDAAGRLIGIFADVAALLDHAEAETQ